MVLLSGPRLSPRRRLGRVLGHVEELSRPGPVEAWVRLPLAPGSGLGSASARNPTRHDALLAHGMAKFQANEWLRVGHGMANWLARRGMLMLWTRD